MPLSQLNLVTGANGSGKSSLYRALRLLSEAARAQVWVVPHASRMIAALKEAKHRDAITLTRELGETAHPGSGEARRAAVEISGALRARSGPFC
jgi:predicted ATPase